jgi:hypothetical protein
VPKAKLRGRPRLARPDNVRVPTSVRLRGQLFNWLSEAASRHDRALGSEIEIRLEASFAPPNPVLPPELYNIALELIAAYATGGERAVVRRLMERGDPDQAERLRRWHTMQGELLNIRANYPLEEPRI